MQDKFLDSVFREVKRVNFVRPADVHNADNDIPLPIGYGQTISQPYTVRLMLEWLDAKPGDKVLDVGSGTGWTTALLCKIVGSTGTVHAVELIPELVEFGKNNCRRIGIKNAHFYQAGEVYGLPAREPYDRILVSASSDDLPKELLAQLGEGGKMVIPIGHTILEITKLKNDGLEIVEHPGFMFVPLL